MNQEQILVTVDNIDRVLSRFKNSEAIACDTETTGFNPYLGDKVFSIILCDDKLAAYFNFNWYKGEKYEPFILSDEHKEKMRPLFSERREWIFQNAKFDLHHLFCFDLFPEGDYYDTQVGGRILNNIEESYSLDAMAERELNERKDDAVKAWLDENKCYQMVAIPGKKTSFKNYFYEQVPFEIISKYGFKDGILTYELWKKQNQDFIDSDSVVVNEEMKLIKTLFHMEKRGVMVDLDFLKEASGFEKERLDAARSAWQLEVGTELVDSGVYLKPHFESLGYEIGYTYKGEPNVDKDVIKKIDHKSARILEECRDAEKRYTTLMGLLNTVDPNTTVHTTFRQTGTVTGRMSSFSPNLQNLAAGDESKYPIRKSFIPRPGYFFVAIDYEQMEFRLMLDYAKELDLIEKIKNGHDPHDATAELTGLDRKAAKTLNFGLVYGMGIQRLADAIGVSYAEAKRFKQQYFSQLPGVKRFLRDSAKRQELRGYTWSWRGRRYKLREQRFSYRAPNSIIQGGCADVVKKAMNEIYDYIGDNHLKSRMLLQVHDEILFEVACDEILEVSAFKNIMESAYPYRNMPLTCSVAYSLESFSNMTEVTTYKEMEEGVREGLSKKGQAGLKEAKEHLVLQGEREKLSGNT